MSSFDNADATGAPVGGENIWISSSDGDIKRVKELVASGVNINAQDEYGYSPLHAAVSYGHDELVKHLLDNGADIDLRDNDGDCAFLYCEDVQTCQLLIHCYNLSGANKTQPMSDFLSGIKNNLGQNLLDKMISDENEEMIAYLINSGHKTGAGASLPEGFKIDLVDQNSVDNPDNLDGQGAFSLQQWQEQQLQEQLAAQEALNQNTMDQDGGAATDQ